MNKYEVRMKATFYYKERVVGTLTLIEPFEAEDMTDAIDKTDILIQNLVAKFDFEGKEDTAYTRLMKYKNMDDIEIDVSAIVPYSG